jgi:hypothetical protein
VVSLLHRIYDVPWLGDNIQKYILDDRLSGILPVPVEGECIYHQYCRFSKHIKSFYKDIPIINKQRLAAVIQGHLQYCGKNRFLSKQTANTQRLDVIDAMFPDARYIHIIRDGRAVANSLFRVDWWKTADLWWLGRKPQEWYRDTKEDPIVLCGRHWKHNVQEIRRFRKRFGGRYLEIRYEDLIREVRPILAKIVRFCGLSETEDYFRLLPRSLPDQNSKWVRELTKQQKQELNKILQPFLGQLGYSRQVFYTGQQW